MRSGGPRRDIAETRYARSGDIRIAYQVLGHGPMDLVFVPGFIPIRDGARQDRCASDMGTRTACRLRFVSMGGYGSSDRQARRGPRAGGQPT
ncbi:MAG: hypothetical protein GEU91_02675 [Rhizobiales bacterium]|nr:hypothetical protein [Hyphomicrobiales bacterium]